MSHVQISPCLLYVALPANNIQCLFLTVLQMKNRPCLGSPGRGFRVLQTLLKIITCKKINKNADGKCDKGASTSWKRKCELGVRLRFHMLRHRHRIQNDYVCAGIQNKTNEWRGRKGGRQRATQQEIDRERDRQINQLVARLLEDVYSIWIEKHRYGPLTSLWMNQPHKPLSVPCG